MEPRLVLGRDRELSVVLHAVQSARRGLAGTVCIAGAPGTGKTTLVDATVDRAAGLAYTVLVARASAAETDVAFGVVRQLFGGVFAESTPAERDQLLTGTAPGVGRLFQARPALSEHAGTPMGPDGDLTELRALHRLAVNLAARAPLLIAVDDLHLADPPSLRWLAYLQRRMYRMPAVLVLTVGADRPDPVQISPVEVGPVEVGPVEVGPVEVGTDRALLVEVLDAAHRLTLGPLDGASSARLVLEVLARPVPVEFAQACHAASDGNPYLLVELLRELRVDNAVSDQASLERLGPQAGQPPWLAARRLDRWRASNPAAAAIARAVAVLATPEPEVAAAAAGIAMPAAIDAVQMLSALGVLRAGRRLWLTSPILRGAIAGGVPPVERDAMHARAATLLRSVGAAPERVAAHLLGTTSVQGEWVGETLAAVGRRAISDGLPDRAVACLRRALREPLPDHVRDQVLLALGIVEIFGATGEAVEHLGAVHQDRASARRLLDLARAYAASTRGESAHRAAELATRGWCQGSLADAGGRTDTDGAELRTASDLCHVVLTYTLADRLEAARHCCEQALDIATAPLVTEIANALTALIGHRAGQVGVALTAARTSLETMSRLGPAGWMVAAIVLPVLVEAAVDCDELTVAQQAVERATFGGELPAFCRYHGLLSSRGRLHAATGDLHAALSDQLECGRRLQSAGVLNPAVIPWRSQAAVLYARLGLPDRAAELVGQDLTLARRWGAPRALGIALRTAGAVSQGERGRALLDESITVLREAGATLEIGRALADLGASLGRTGRYDEAVANLLQASELAERCGAVALLRQVDGQLAVMPGRPSPSQRHELTPHELRVARMVVSGMTNREIAGELRISSRAVELHLTKLYRKLGIGRRSQLAVALNGNPFGPPWLPRQRRRD